ncbi:unnamed protein product [Ectocarpus fasciculatus]
MRLMHTGGAESLRSCMPVAHAWREIVGELALRPLVLRGGMASPFSYEAHLEHVIGKADVLECLGGPAIHRQHRKK